MSVVVDVETVGAEGAVGIVTNDITVVCGNRDHGDRKPKNQKNPTPMFACQLCKQDGHWVSRCPLLQQASLLVAPRMALAQPAPPPAVSEDRPRAYAARISDGRDDDDDDGDDDDGFEGEFLPLVALAGVRGGPGRDENYPGPRGRNGKSRNPRRMSTGSIGANGDLRRFDFGEPPPRGPAKLDVKFHRRQAARGSNRTREFAAQPPPEGESSW
jgi:hypothetical protein